MEPILKTSPRLSCATFGLLAFLTQARLTAQTPATAPAATCTARQLDIFDEGRKSVSRGSRYQTIGLRNVSAHPCTIQGVPTLQFAAPMIRQGRRVAAGREVAVPYSRNSGDSRATKQDGQPVTLAAGEFAYFVITGAFGGGLPVFDAMRVTLPGDDLSLTISGVNGYDWDQGRFSAINVSSIRTGIDTGTMLRG